MYPNEILFIYMNPVFYNMTMIYNFSHYYLNLYKESVLIYHFNAVQYKVIDIIRDGYIDKFKPKDIRKKQIVIDYKLKYYDKYHEFIDKIIKQLS